ncbi:MAG: Nif3-like dinuclear metal center hexameric protein [Acidobacteriaceae bacterium]
MRISLILAVSLLLPFPLAAQNQSSTQLTAAQVIQRIQQAIPKKAPADTMDTIKAGDPATIVTGIVTCFTDTMDVLRQAVALHANLIVTHEPTFYNHRDENTLFVNDPVYKEKLAYMRDHHLVVWRFHDQWHLRQPEPMTQALAAAVGWQKYQRPGDPFSFTLPPTTVDALAQQLQTKLHARIVRVVGDPNLRVTGVAYRPGASGEARQVQALERDDVQVLVAGESSEWETVMYTQDAQQQHRPKALILVGHSTSETDGMQTAAAWLHTLFPTLPVQYVNSGEPYWLPGHPPQ